jgi:hypothetical protein
MDVRCWSWLRFVRDVNSTLAPQVIKGTLPGLAPTAAEDLPAFLAWFEDAHDSAWLTTLRLAIAVRSRSDTEGGGRSSCRSAPVG